jgi:hypothetical protein
MALTIIFLYCNIMIPHPLMCLNVISLGVNWLRKLGGTHLLLASDGIVDVVDEPVL